jgi:transposase
MIGSDEMDDLPHEEAIPPKKREKHNYETATRAQVVALKLAGISNTRILELTGLEKATVNAILRRAIERGLDTKALPARILDIHVADAKRSGRPPVLITDELKEAVLAKVLTDRFGREKTYAYIAEELKKEGTKISAVTVWKCLKKAGFHKTKATRKPGLTQKMKDTRLQWCINHQYWTLEQ